MVDVRTHPGERGPRRWLRRGGALLAAVLVAGCAGVPTSGSPHAIEEHADVPQADADRPYVWLLPPAPQPGQSAQAVMGGFLVAMADFTDNHAAARRYLTPAQARDWDPEARTVVYADLRPAATAAAPDTFEYTVSPIAVLSRDHGFTLYDVQETYDAKAVRVSAGQWRLTGMRPGTLLSVADFQRAFRGVDVYFPARTGAVLVPDHVFLPVPPADLPLAMVRQLVAGPTSWLSPAVRRVAPAGTAVRSVAVDAAGTADVVLADTGGRLDAQGRRLLLAALTWTLADQLADVKAVRLTVDGVPVTARPTTLQDESSLSPGAFPSGSRATYVDGGHVQQLQPDAQAPQPAVQPALAGGRFPVAPVGARGLAAVRHRHGTDDLVVYTGARWQTVYQAHRLSPPTWMPDGSSVWAIATRRDGGQRVVAVSLSGSDGDLRAARVPVAVDLTGSALRRVGRLSALRLSRDGTRVAFIRADPAAPAGGARPYVARIGGQVGQPTIAGLRPLAPACPVTGNQRCLTAAVDLAWADADRLVVLANTNGSDPQAHAPYLVSADGSSVQPIGTAGLSSDAVSVTAAPDVPMLVVVPAAANKPSEGAQIYKQSGDSWVRVANGYDVRYPD